MYSIKKRISALLLAGMLCAGLLMTGCSNSDKDDTSKASASNVSAVSSPDVLDRIFEDDTIVKSENYSLSKPMVSFLYNNYYNEARDTYATYLGLDVTKSLKEQIYEQKQCTWFDFFMNQTKQYITQILVECEAAKAEGMELDETSKKNVELTLQSINDSAKASGLSVDEYITVNFGKGLTEDMIKEYLELTALASQYREKVMSGYKFTDEDYEKYYSEHKTDYQYADFLKFNFTFADSNSASSEVSVDQDRKDKAKAYAEDLAKCKTAQAFKDYITKYYKDNPSLLTPTEAEQSLPIEDLIKIQVDNTVKEKYAYEVTSEAGKWIFDVSREPLDTKVFDGSSYYTVVMVTKTAYRDESLYKNVRHILVKTSNDGSSESSEATENYSELKAKEKADKIYKEWKDGEATEESFAELAKKYSDDQGSSSDGGLYTDVSYGMMVSEFNDWLFDNARKVGDTGIVKTTYGYHIMYFVGDGEQIWKKSVNTVMVKNAYSDSLKDLTQKYNVTFDEAYIQTIEETEKTVETSGAESSVEESKAESSVEESKAESSVEESKAESSAEESKAESSAEESKAESSAEESKAESSAEESKAESSTEESKAE